MRGGREGSRTRIALLGSTGSIGRQALDVLARDPGRFSLVALAAGRDATRFAEQVQRFRPHLASLADEAALQRLDLPAGTRAVGGPDALERLATDPEVDLVLVATGGLVSLRPVLAALRAGKVVATANKETLVAGGHLAMPLARGLATNAAGGAPVAANEALAWLRPIDSEHSAIWQCLAGERMADVRRLLLTASGGPFREGPLDLEGVRPADALAHPTWRMGAKITVDSATLMNKGLEIVEAHWLYDVDYDRIEVVIHPQSVIHSMVQYRDTSVVAQLGTPDMRVPIAFGLAWPERVASGAQPLDFGTLADMSFESLDSRGHSERFPGLQLAWDALAAAPGTTAVLNAANEVAVAAFLERRIRFDQIHSVNLATLAGLAPSKPQSLQDLLALDADARRAADAAIRKLAA